MDDQDHGAASRRLMQRLQEGAFGVGVEARRRLIQDQHRRVGQQRPRQHQPPRLTTREPRPGLAAARVEAIRQGADQLADPGLVQRAPQRRRTSIRPGEAQIGLDSIVEQPRILRQAGDARADIVGGERRDIDAAQQDPPRLRRRELQQQRGQRGLTHPRRPEQRDTRPFRHIEVEPIEDRRAVRRPGEMHTLHPDRMARGRGGRVGGFGDRRGRVGGLEQAARAGGGGGQRRARTRQQPEGLRRRRGQEQAKHRAGHRRLPARQPPADGTQHRRLGQNMPRSTTPGAAPGEHPLRRRKPRPFLSHAAGGNALGAGGQRVLDPRQRIDGGGAQATLRGRHAPPGLGRAGRQQRRQQQRDRQRQRDQQRERRRHRAEHHRDRQHHRRRRDRRHQHAEIQAIQRIDIRHQPPQ